ncbi:transporter substrate-binding domain-containing protein [Clostridium sp.]|jgi:polar amino acid transport system substrate-binding protein|uniref:transporter substrate-binding domain-containing protein n=1 Tax=Clostridium sp. TaxID=1506 RepID=UPI00258D6D0E|nr:transporter substrate-binding domain-containing protein [Clostridium sp.]MDF2503992.1 Glutamine-binding periplasmic protein fused to glutamine permease [Clostridium sp.]
MKKRLIAAITVVSIIAGTLMVGCQSTSSNQASNKKYTIAIDSTYAPFDFKSGNQYTGIDVDLLAAIAKVEGFTYDLKPMNFNGIIPALAANQVDGALAGMTITDARKKTLDFSDGYFESGLSAVVKKDNTKINGESDFANKTFAVKKGTDGAKFADQNKDKYKATVKYFDDSPSMFQEVLNGNADIAFDDYPVVGYKLKVDPNTNLKMIGDKLQKDYYGFAVKKGTNKELLQKFNDGLKKLKANGEYDKIISKYIKK